MWKEELLILYTEKYREILKKNLLPIALGLVGLILLGVGLIYSINSPTTGSGQEDNIIFESGLKEIKQAPQIVVDVSGAVVSPGVYTLDLGSRVKDALISASGLSSDANRDWVSKNLNLASKLNDGSKIYIPSKGEVSLRETNSAGVVSTSGLININSASPSELDGLPGIGPATAQKIIDNRPYASIEDLTSKKVVSSKIFEKIKDRINVY